MRKHLVSAGKALAGAGLTGTVAYLVNPTRTNPTWPYSIFVGLILVGVVLYLAGSVGRRASTEPEAATTVVEAAEDVSPTVPGPAFTDRWRHTSNGHEAPGLLMITQKSFSHPGYMKQLGDRPPFVRIGITVACEPLGPSPATSALRDRFLAFLTREPTSELISGLTHVGEELSWRCYAGHGRINSEAALTSGDEQQTAPVASALLILSEANMPRYGHDQRVAELVLHIEPRAEDDSPVSPAKFAVWHQEIVRALTVAGAFEQFLSQDVGLATSEDPPAQLAIQLDTQRGLTELIDVGDLRPLPGSGQSNSFLGFTVADRDGKQPADAAREFLTRICDHALRLHRYEAELDKLPSRREEPELQAPRQALQGLGADGDTAPEKSSNRRGSKS